MTRIARNSQQGAVLLISLVLLLILTTLAVTAASTSALQERMSSNAQQANTAFQAAENGLANTIAMISSYVAPPADQTYRYCRDLDNACGNDSEEADRTARTRVVVAAKVEDGYSLREGSGTPMVMTYDLTSSASLDKSATTIDNSNTNALHRQGYMTVEIR
ncbi:PilX N-terminal domain-containing pilus assembly protein [Metapseudomonas resinovorans]|uniref:Putative type 4 pili assembly protein PilX n=1 Tax=Metapseudomonas resinovorans NBRC 106553 TaxID=1245471 RepID=S6AME6_METRE|nr:PilX N-terminal domain-containing pilus assembly protein [Pseudomonas resinovorans]BAN46668.1 putative type 4 pili assembly protein PilX [Pseudomonas resinovorans NBRC 106553]